MDTPIICHGCGHTGSVGRVTAGLICATCGHGDDLDIFDGKVANRWNAEHPEEGRGAATPQPGFGNFMRQQQSELAHNETHPDYDPETNPNPWEHNTREGKIAAGPNESAGGNGATGWGKKLPDPDEDWNEYVGPSVGPNPLTQQHLDGTADAYSGTDWERGNPGYSPSGGYEKTTWPNGPTTGIPPIEEWDEHRGPQSGGARWQGKQSSVAPLHVTFPNGVVWEGVGRVVSQPKSASKDSQFVRKMAAKISETNPGLSTKEALDLARRAEKKLGSE